MPLPSQTEIEASIGRISLTPDGRLLYRYLQLQLVSLAPTTTGALPHHEGRRSLAHDIKSLMDRELSKAGPERDRSGIHDPDEPVIERPASPVDGAGGRGSRRRITGYDSDPA